MTKKIAGVAAAIVLALTSATITPEAQAQGGFVQQGDRVYHKQGDGMMLGCTVGYVDKWKRTFTFAGHCSTNPDGNVYGSNPDGSVAGYIGTVIHNPHDGYGAHNDLAHVAVADGVAIGDNIYSGDVWIAPHQVRLGEPICTYGASSKRVKCGRFTSRSGMNVLVSSVTYDNEVVSGDSGGPAWIPGRGLVGVNHGVYAGHNVHTYPDINYGRIVVPSPVDIKKQVEDSINEFISVNGLPIARVRI